ncbi:MAG: hypothetical protein ACJ72U_06845, partial [Nitrososphaeraceae archaeon]
LELLVHIRIREVIVNSEKLYRCWKQNNNYYIRRMYHKDFIYSLVTVSFMSRNIKTPLLLAEMLIANISDFNRIVV